VFLRRRIRKTLDDLYCPYLLPEAIAKFTRKARGHFVTLIEIGVHLFTFYVPSNVFNACFFRY